MENDREERLGKFFVVLQRVCDSLLAASLQLGIVKLIIRELQNVGMRPEVLDKFYNSDSKS